MSHISISKPERQAHRQVVIYRHFGERIEQLFKPRAHFKSKLKTMLQGCVLHDCETFWKFSEKTMKPEGYSAPWYELFNIAFSTFNTDWKTLLGFGVQAQFQKKKWHMIKICCVKYTEGYRNKGWVECMCSFHLQYIFPPSLAVRAPRCTANKTPLSGYLSWKVEHEKYNRVRVCVCVRHRVKEVIESYFKKVPVSFALHGQISF